MKRVVALTLTAAVCLVGPVAVSSSASAAPAAAQSTSSEYQVAAKKKVKKYKNCTALNKDFKHGIRKKGGKDKVRGKSDPVPAKLIPIRTKLYNANTKLDRDKDGVACEKA
ncbi:excalibur calcium-binding domain-containing protein [Kineosporia babensis]|uniref:Excalibur calcium-binding domain-containing protein n=1 Tax=Kineosporia babensis TaxID=499548 RepID=A0A9X1NDR9_9ACTN|nr:excalibur calcium-binding domain-containing protein [Kineosporia babensis]MCD5311193.1 excalibur calcium-binding domain-containing protein [Kineosporia babensis]